MQVIDNTNRRGFPDETRPQAMRAYGLMACKCGLCGHDSRESCIKDKCQCCDLEDVFSILSQNEFVRQKTRI